MNAWITKIRSYLRQFIELGVLLLGVSVLAEILFGPDVAFLGSQVTKNKGLICFTINEGIYEEYGFDKKIDELKKLKKWNIKEFFKSDYIKSKGVNAWLCLAEVIK